MRSIEEILEEVSIAKEELSSELDSFLNTDIEDIHGAFTYFRKLGGLFGTKTSNKIRAATVTLMQHLMGELTGGKPLREEVFESMKSMGLPGFRVGSATRSMNPQSLMRIDSDQPVYVESAGKRKTVKLDKKPKKELVEEESEEELDLSGIQTLKDFNKTSVMFWLRLELGLIGQEATLATLLSIFSAMEEEDGKVATEKSVLQLMNLSSEAMVKFQRDRKTRSHLKGETTRKISFDFSREIRAYVQRHVDNYVTD